MEVLISTFVIAIGLLGLAALIPVGRFTLVEAGKADRAGACGRAAMRDVKVRGMLDYNYWSPAIVDTTPNVAPFAIDPLGVNASLGALGPITRRSLSYLVGNQTLAQSIFLWHDDLLFSMPENMTTPPANTERPQIVDFDANNLPDVQGDYSWFITVVPSANENDRPGFPNTGVQLRNKKYYTVSVVVCYKRDLSTAGEHTTVPAPGGVTFLGGGYGGGSVTLTFGLTDEVDMREGQWIMLYGTNAGKTQCSWYRLVTVGEIDPTAPTVRYVSLAGPDWNTSTATAVIIDGVIGVYTTTIEIDR